MQVQILNQISQVSDNLETPVLGKTVDVISSMEMDFSETQDMEGEVGSIMETTDNLKRSLDFGVQNFTKEDY